MKISKFLLLTASLALCIEGHSQELSLQDCLREGIEHNFQIKNAELDVKAAKLQKDEALTEYFPRVKAIVLGYYAMNPLIQMSLVDLLGDNDLTRFWQNELKNIGSEYGINTDFTALKSGYSTSLMVVQPIYAGGRIVNGNRLASLGKKAAYLQKDLELRKLTQDIEKQWWQIYSIEEQINTLIYLDTTLTSLHSRLKSAIDSGLAGETDILQLEVKRSELEAGRKKAESGLKLLKTNLLNTIGIDYTIVDSVRFVFTESLPLSPADYYMDEDIIVENMQEKELLGLQISAKSLEKKMAIGEALPQIAIGANAGYSDLNDKAQFNTVAFATISIPLSDWGKTAKKAQRIETQIQKAHNQELYYEDQLHLLVQKQWIELDSAFEQWQIQKQTKEMAERLYNVSLSNYNAGLIPIQDLLNAETSFRQAVTQETEALVNYRNAITDYTSLHK